MKKWLSVFLALVMSVMCGMAMALPAYAEELPGVSVPVTITLSGTLPNPAEGFNVVLKADDADYPMPEGAADGTYTMTVTGEGTESFPSIPYSRVGVYTYKVYQEAGTNEKCTYDDTVYTLVVTVSNKEDFSGLETTAVLYPDSEGDKLPAAEFDNKYEVEQPAEVPQTGDEFALLPFAALCVISMGVIVALLLARKSKKIEE